MSAIYNIWKRFPAATYIRSSTLWYSAAREMCFAVGKISVRSRCSTKQRISCTPSVPTVTAGSAPWTETGLFLPHDFQLTDHQPYNSILTKNNMRAAVKASLNQLWNTLYVRTAPPTAPFRSNSRTGTPYNCTYGQRHLLHHSAVILVPEPLTTVRTDSATYCTISQSFWYRNPLQLYVR